MVGISWSCICNMKNYKIRKVKVQACSAQYRSDGGYLENLSKFDNVNSLTTT
jgi:hypothetical protein